MPSRLLADRLTPAGNESAGAQSSTHIGGVGWTAQVTGFAGGQRNANRLDRAFLRPRSCRAPGGRGRSDVGNRARRHDLDLFHDAAQVPVLVSIGSSMVTM
jgi:hypothetical protein